MGAKPATAQVYKYTVTDARYMTSGIRLPVNY